MVYTILKMPDAYPVEEKSIDYGGVLLYNVEVMYTRYFFRRLGYGHHL